MTQKNKNLIRLLCLIPVTIGIAMGVFQYFDCIHTGILLKGALTSLIGGALVGYLAKRFLNESHRSTTILFALAALSLVGLISIGIVYFVLLPDPIHTVSDPQRAAAQVLIFIQYLAAIGLGITLVKE